MLKHQELCSKLRANHERIQARIWHRAPGLTANVDKLGATAVVVLIAQPVTLLESAVVKVIEVVDLVIEGLLHKLFKVDIRPIGRIEDSCGNPESI